MMFAFDFLLTVLGVLVAFRLWAAITRWACKPDVAASELLTYLPPPIEPTIAFPEYEEQLKKLAAGYRRFSHLEKLPEGYHPGHLPKEVERLMNLAVGQ